jgi:hypothetical protein
MRERGGSKVPFASASVKVLASITLSATWLKQDNALLYFSYAWNWRTGKQKKQRAPDGNASRGYGLMMEILPSLSNRYHCRLSSISSGPWPLYRSHCKPMASNLARVGTAGQVSFFIYREATWWHDNDMPRRHLSITNVTHVEDSVDMGRVALEHFWARVLGSRVLSQERAECGVRTAATPSISCIADLRAVYLLMVLRVLIRKSRGFRRMLFLRCLDKFWNWISQVM